MSATKQVKPETHKSWLQLYSSLHPYVESFYKFITYYIINHNYNIDIRNIRIQIVGYIMSMKRKRRTKLKEKGYAEDRYHHVFNNVLESNSQLLQSNTQKGCCTLNTTNYNYKLRSVIGQTDNSKVTK